MDGLVFKSTPESEDAYIMEIVKKGESIYFQVIDCELDFEDIPYDGAASVIAFFAYELGARRMHAFMREHFNTTK